MYCPNCSFIHNFDQKDGSTFTILNEEKAMCHKCKCEFTGCDSFNYEWGLMIKNSMENDISYEKCIQYIEISNDWKKKNEFESQNKGFKSSIFLECFYKHTGSRAEDAIKNRDSFLRDLKIKIILNEAI